LLAIAVLMLVACAGGLYGAFLVRRERQTRVATLIHELEAPEGEQPQGGGPGLLRKLQRLAPQAVLESYGERLVWVGRPYGLDAGQFFGLKVVGAVLLPALVPVIGLFQLGSLTLAFMLAAVVAGFVLPDIWLGGRVARRRVEVQEELPLFTDLIATAVSAGLPLTEAVRRVAADAPGLVAREFLRAVQEMAAGKPRMQAWRDLMDRLPGDEFRSIVTAIMQAEQYGTSVSDILRYQVQQIRTFIRPLCHLQFVVR